VLKHCSNVDNEVGNALSRKFCTLYSFSAKGIGFEYLIHECFIHDYPTCRDFGKIYASLTQNSHHCQGFHHY